MNYKKDFPIFERKINGKEIIFLDSGASTQKPKQVINTIKKFYETNYANIHRGVYTLSQESTEQYENARETIAQFIGAKPNEIILTKGTTESINLLANTLHPLTRHKKEIVLSEMEHHANLVPWQEYAKKHDMTIKYIPIKKDYTLDYEQAKKIITNKTAIVSIIHISNVLGTINNVKLITKLAKENGAISIIDAAQSVGHIPVDVKKLNCDFLAFSGHKMLGPTGTGILYGRKELLDKMQPYQFGGDMIKEVTYKKTSYANTPHKFEAGTPNITGFVGLASAIKYLQKIGIKNIQKHDQELLNYALKELKKVKTLTSHNAGTNKSASIISFTLKNAHPHDIASLLNDKNICVRAGHHCAMPLLNKLKLTGTTRASFYLYNTKTDIDTLVKELQKIEKVFT